MKWLARLLGRDPDVRLVSYDDGVVGEIRHLSSAVHDCEQQLHALTTRLDNPNVNSIQPHLVALLAELKASAPLMTSLRYRLCEEPPPVRKARRKKSRKRR